MNDAGQPLRFGWGNESNWNKVRTGTAAGGGYVDSILDGPRQHGFDEFFGMGGNFYLDEQSSLKAFIEDNAFQGIPTWNGAPGAGSAGPGSPTGTSDASANATSTGRWSLSIRM